MNPLPTHIPLYYWANPPTLNTRQYIAQGLVYPMNTVHTVQSFLDTFCQNGLQFRIICACKAVKGANRTCHSVITASWLNSPPPTPTRTLVMSSLLYPPVSLLYPCLRPTRCLSHAAWPQDPLMVSLTLAALALGQSTKKVEQVCRSGSGSWVVGRRWKGGNHPSAHLGPGPGFMYSMIH